MKYLKNLLCIILMFVLVAGSVNLTAKPVEAVTLDSTSKQVWDYLRSKGFSEYATAGIMGNIWAESNMRANNLQDYTISGYTDDSYTKAVDSGKYTKKMFMYDSAGYGLCQWTYWSRKQGLYDMAKSQGRSIGDIKIQLDYLIYELKHHYTSAVNKLKSAKSVKEASNVILHDFERPADQSAWVENRRAVYGEEYYKKYAKSKIPTTGGPNIPLRRIYGSNRYGTALGIAEAYMTETKQSKLDSIIVACGTKFPDALSATYLANVNKAPIIIWSEPYTKLVQDFIKKNVKKKGTVYLLGGPTVVGDEVKTGMKGYTFKRIYGSTRYETNTQLINTAGMTKGEVLVCDGTDGGKGINALVAVATGRPVLLVEKGGLRDAQKDWILKNEKNITKFVLVGDTNSVNSTIEGNIKSYGIPVKRITGKNGDEVSAAIAKAYFTNPKEIYISTMDNFPDALCGGPLAIANKGPLLLLNDSSYGSSGTYTKALTGIKRANVFGGTIVVSNDTVIVVTKNSSGAWTVIEK